MTTTPEMLIPPDWHQVEDPDTGLTHVEPRQMPASGFMPWVTIFGASLQLPLPVLLEEQTKQFQTELSDAVIEEVEIHDLGERDAGYLRALHHGDGRHLVTELWIWPVPRGAWFLSATVALADYPDYDELFETMAWSFRPG